MAGQALVWVDLDAAEALLNGAENQGYASQAALPLLEEARGYLERGAYLEGETGTWRYGFEGRSERALKRCRLWLAENYEAGGKYWQAGEVYRRLLQSMPPDEKALQRWMVMLHKQGKRLMHSSLTRK